MIVYFTGTGNSRYAAEYISLVTGDALTDASDSIRRRKPAKLTSETPYVFVCPIYAWRIPRIFSEWIKEGIFEGDQRAYFVITCGADIGSASAELKKLCAVNHLAYMGTVPVVMPDNYLILSSVPDRAESEKIIAAADCSLKEIAASIKRQEPLPAAKTNLLTWVESVVINPMFYSFYASAKNFTVDNKCIVCGKCRSHCPCANISMERGRPDWGNHCTHCMACISGCPTEAIEYGKSTVGKRRYFNTAHPRLEDE